MILVGRPERFSRVLLQMLTYGELPPEKNEQNGLSTRSSLYGIGTYTVGGFVVFDTSLDFFLSDTVVNGTPLKAVIHASVTIPHL